MRTEAEDILYSLLPAYRLMRMEQHACKPLAHILETGKGGLHEADAKIRNDAIEYHIQADWIDDFAKAWPRIRSLLDVDYDHLGRELHPRHESNLREMKDT